MNTGSARISPDYTIGSLIRSQAILRPDQPSIVSPGRAPLSYADLGARQQSSFAQLRSFGVGRADRVALVASNGPIAATAFLCLASACACAPLNPAYKAEELEFYFRDLGARFVVAEHSPDSPAQTAARSLNLPLIQLFAEGASCRFGFAGARSASSDAPPGPNDIALLLHTSGTTSKPKLVPLLHRNLCASAGHIAAALGLTPADRCLNIMPLFHIHGLVAAVLATLGTGGSLVCTDGAYGSGFFHWLNEYSPTWYTAVPTMHMGILGKAAEHAGNIAEKPLRFIRSSSSALPPQVLRGLEAAFRAPVIEAYGMTEAAHQMTCNPLPPAPRKPGSVGPQAGPEVAIMDARGHLLDRGATGEVVIRGPNVMPGYLDNPQANRSAFTDGWFRTGDQGRIDPDGYLFLTGRLKELINRGGEKISPREIDEILLDHPEVKQALTFAIPHARLGEEIGAAVVLAPGSRTTESGLREFVATRLAPFKVPRLIRILPEIPKGPTGKPQRLGLAAKLGIGTMDADQAPAPYRLPESPLEEQICAIWRDMLRCGRVGILDTFSSLGGDSLLAARMLAAVSEAIGADLPFSDFLEQGTILSLAREIERHRAGRFSSGPLVDFRTAGSRTPLICIPGHDGILVGFSHLARLLNPDQPVYGLEAPQPKAFQGEAWNIRSFAAHYADALIGRFQKQPVHLAGICFGGVIAFELARQLEQRGAAVQSLILMDTLNPAWERGLGLMQRLAAQGTMICERGEAHRKTLWELGWRGAGKYLSERAQAFVACRRENAELRRMRDAAASARNLPLVLRRIAMFNYQAGPYSGPVTMIRVRGLRPKPPLMGWRGAATGKVSVVAIDFCPRGMIAEPAVATVARLVSEVIG